ncbi:MAG: aminopeptidase [Ruminococcaceae bacterium]|jgi:aminopeptidase|nr:aminopeptidase [Oscillospiraceae bacterium]
MEQKLREYAELLIRVGLGLRDGQTLLLSAPVECARFARLCATAAYDAGAREVVLDWRDDALDRARYLNAEDDVFDTHPAWNAHLLNDLAQGGAASLTISAKDPEAFKGVDPERVRRAQYARLHALAPFYGVVMKNEVPWCVASVPIPSWAKRVFPELPKREAMSMLWDAIFDSVRITGDGKAVERWNEHLEMLETRRKKLNELRLKKLHYTNDRGTDLTVELPEGHIWRAGRSVMSDGRTFVPNMPAEAIFTAPLKTGANGVVISSLPLVLSGNIVDKFQFVLRNGRIVKAFAEKGRDFLNAAISVDENACYFGEISLVPFDSPISRRGILYYNTLFDENMRCHIAIGSVNPECIEGGEQMTDEELAACGLNRSVVHTDFMIGTADLSIVGTTADGREVPVFIDGNFAL